MLYEEKVGKIIYDALSRYRITPEFRIELEETISGDAVGEFIHTSVIKIFKQERKRPLVEVKPDYHRSGTNKPFAQTILQQIASYLERAYSRNLEQNKIKIKGPIKPKGKSGCYTSELIITRIIKAETQNSDSK